MKELIRFDDAFVGTIAHTTIDYLGTVFNVPTVEVAEILGRKLSPKKSEADQKRTGMTIHFLLGSLLFPLTYNLTARHLLPNKPAGSFIWAMMLWVTGQILVMPLCGASDKFRRKPTRIFTYLLAHVVYGIACSKKRKVASRAKKKKAE